MAIIGQRRTKFDCAYYSFLSTKLVVEQLKIIMVVYIEFVVAKRAS